MTKLIVVVILSVIVQNVQPQRSPYAGSANKFRGQPINLATEMSSLPTTVQSSSIATQARTVELATSRTTATSTTTSTTTTTTTTAPISIPESKISLLSGRFSEFDLNQSSDEYPDYYQNHHHHRGGWHKHRGGRDFDYGFF